jgi:hypothetical protein
LGERHSRQLKHFVQLPFTLTKFQRGISDLPTTGAARFTKISEFPMLSVARTERAPCPPSRSGS